MFSKMQKFHKAFLVFVTVLLTASFGLGGVCARLTDPQELTTAGTMAKLDRSYKVRELEEARQYWDTIHRLAMKLSPKAQAILESDFSQQEQYRLLMARNPQWDTLFSLHSAVSELDKEFAEQKKQQQAAQNPLLQRWERFQYYINLPAEKKNPLRKSLSKKEVWNRLILLERAKNKGIVVTQEEVEQLIESMVEALGGIQRYNDTLRSLRINHSQFKSNADKALLVLKYINFELADTKISLETAYQSKETQDRFKLQYVRFPEEDFLVTSNKEYQELRRKFFQQKQKSNPNFFVNPANVDFEFFYVAAETFRDDVQVSEEEIEEYLQQNKSKYQTEDNQDLSDEELLVDYSAEIEQVLKGEKAAQKAREFLAEIQSKLSGIKGIYPLADLSEQYREKVLYQQQQGVSEKEFMGLEHVATQEAKSQLFSQLAVGEVSPVLAQGSKGYFFLQLSQRQAQQKITQEQVVENEDVFLRRYYEENAYLFAGGEEYRLAYVVTNYDTIRDNLLLTTKILQDFYDKYKDELYRKTGQEGEVIYQPFEAVKEDVTRRALHYYTIEELEKIQVVHRNLKEKSEDLDLANVVREMADVMMKAKGGLQYIEKPRLQTLDEIRKDNPTGAENFPVGLNKDERISEIQDSSKGKYFYIVLEHRPGTRREFSEIKDKVKEKYLSEEALKKAQAQAQIFKQEYEEEYKLLQAELEEKIASQTELSEQERERQIRQSLQQLAVQLLKGMAWKRQLEYGRVNKLTAIDNIPAFAGALQLGFVLKDLGVRELSRPIKEDKLGTVFLVQPLARETTAADRTPLSEMLQVRNNLWQQRQQEILLEELTNHQKLREQVGLETTAEGEDLEEF